MTVGVAEKGQAGIRRAAVALVGNPNTGKTTLFNALTGMSQRVGNFPGVTVERKVGHMALQESATADLIDLPGSYSLSAQSPDEAIAVKVLLGLWPGERSVDAIVAVLDASNLKRNLYLVSQLLELHIPLVVALNMSDVARTRGIVIDTDVLSRNLGVPVVAVQANRRSGVRELKDVLAKTLQHTSRAPCLNALPDAWRGPVTHMAETHRVSPALVLRALLDSDTSIQSDAALHLGVDLAGDSGAFYEQFGEASALSEREIAGRYAWAESVLADSMRDPDPLRLTHSDAIDRVLTHRVWGTLIFAAVMAVVFQSIFAWAAPLMDVIDTGFGWLGDWVSVRMPEGALQSLVVDGVVAGVGGVVIFLPQICVLFLFLAVLEDCGYMARAAFLMDRLLTRCGLSGKSFIPMLSSFACAVPGIMATRTIDDPKDRIATMLVAPLMSCSARLPVYAIFIAAFIPDRTVWGIGLQGITLFAMYGLGIAIAVPVAWILKKTLLRGETTPFILELPSYKMPDIRTVAMRVYQSAQHFLERAGTLILAATVVMWALAYFPRPQEALERYGVQKQLLVQEGVDAARLAEFDARMSSELLAQSFLGRLGHVIEPVVRPLGWDWRIGMATLASFPAREVVVAVLGTIYSLGDVDGESESLRSALQRARWPDGRPVFTVAVALSIMVFFALCAQCAATLAVIQRESGTWRWPLFTLGYMTGLAYLGAFAVYRVGLLLGWGA